MLNLLENERGPISLRLFSDTSADNVPIEALKNEIANAGSAMNRVLPTLKLCGGCTVLGIPGALEAAFAHCTREMTVLENNPEIYNPFALSLLQRQVRGILDGIQKIESITLVEYADPKDERKGFYRSRDTTIHINTHKCKSTAEKNAVMDHERGHAVIDILTEKTDVLLGTVEEVYNNLTIFTKKEHPTTPFDALLDRAAVKWGLDGETKANLITDGNDAYPPNGGEALFNRKLMEELYMQYGSYVDQQNHRFGEKPKKYSQDERTLFSIIDSMRREGVKPKHKNSGPTLRYEAATRHRDEDDSTPSAADNVEENNAGKIKGDLQEIATMISFVKSFLATYPNEAAKIGTFASRVEQNYDDLKQMLETGRNHLEGNISIDPYSDQNYSNNIKKLKVELENCKKCINNFDRENRDTSNAPRVGLKSMWGKVTTDIQWLSIMDHWMILNEGWEDLSRLWKRRGENARGKVGEKLTEWIGDRIPYMGQLKYEYHRRQQDSELSAVQVWEKALENVDSYALIEQIPHINSQDHLKAVLNLLSKRGRLEWDDKHVWEAINRFSHFQMPIHECERDTILRDRWLQKCISDIWSDKDLYRHLKTGNESNFNSERNKYDNQADYFANSGELPKQLEFQLRTFLTAKGTKSPIPEEVNPHIYEGLLNYAITRGKMSMEEKFFYLIQGLRSGILPFDRLAILNAQVSTEMFPFIDFFYAHNNTPEQIALMGERLEESENKYKPGLKTKLFLQFEVSKDEQARQRVYKVVDKKGDLIDHEDVPQLVAMLTYGQLNNYLKPIGGQKQRITAEGIKNAYVGYNTIFKAHAMLAKEKADKTEVLTRENAEFLASRLVAYLHFDNIVVRRASAGGSDRPNIEPEVLDELCPSGDVYSARHFRSCMDNVAVQIVDAYGISTLSTPEGDITIDDYLGRTPGSTERTTVQIASTNQMQKKIFLASSDLFEKITNAILRDPSHLTQILATQGETLTNEGENQFTYTDSLPVLRNTFGI